MTQQQSYSGITNIAHILTSLRADEMQSSIIAILSLHKFLSSHTSKPMAVPTSQNDLYEKFRNHPAYSLLNEMFLAAKDAANGSEEAKTFLEDIQMLAAALHAGSKFRDDKLLLVNRIDRIVDPVTQYKVLQHITFDTNEEDQKIAILLAKHEQHSVKDLVRLLNMTRDRTLAKNLRNQIVDEAAAAIKEEMGKNAPAKHVIRDMVRVANDAAYHYESLVDSPPESDWATRVEAGNFKAETAKQFNADKIIGGPTMADVKYTGIVSPLQIEIERMQKVVKQLEAEKAELEQVNKAQAAEIEALKRTNKDLDSRNTSLEGTVKSKSDALDKATKTILEMSDDIQDIAAEADKMSSSLFSKNVKNTRGKARKVREKYNDRGM